VSTEATAGENDENSLAGSIRVSPDKALIEQWLNDAVASRLGLNPAEIDTARPVVYYGVDSLIAVDLTHAMETALGVNLSVTDLLQSPSLAKLAAQLFDCLTGPAKEIHTQATVTVQETPLSYGQRALWFLHELAPESGAYNIAAAARIHSPLERSAFEEALHQRNNQCPLRRRCSFG
jgi:acyl carrier protein